MAVALCEFPLDEIEPMLYALKTHRPRTRELGRAIREIERAGARARASDAALKRHRDLARRERTARIPDEPLIPQSMSRRARV